MVFVEVIGAVIAVVFFFVSVRKWKHGYWGRNNIPYDKPHFMWGNFENPFDTKLGLKMTVKNYYDKFRKQGQIHGGIYMMANPIYIPVDLELIKNIFTRDFQHFTGHGLGYDKENDPLSGHIFNLDGEDWRNIRVKLTPTFTSGKMKMMFNTLLDCGIPMLDHIEDLCKNRNPLDLKKILASYTTDVIGSCAFGIECNSFKNPDSEFLRYGDKIFNPPKSNSLMLLLAFVLPQLRKVFSGARSVTIDIENFFINLIRSVMDYRRANGITRNDFMHLFIEMQDKAKARGEETLTLPEITAQAFAFFLAGFETSSSTMSLCLHELAFNQDIQDKVREEVKTVLKKYKGELTYDGITEMKYMENVISETLRKYPIVPMILRECTLDYKVPTTNVTIKKGTKAFISTLGIHRNEEYYPNPEKFDPERFTDENKANRPACAYIPFGEGPRICIGMRFAQMQTKTGLSMLLNKYKFVPVDGDTYKFEFAPRAFNLSREGKMEVIPIKI